MMKKEYKNVVLVRMGCVNDEANYNPCSDCGADYTCNDTYRINSGYTALYMKQEKS